MGSYHPEKIFVYGSLRRGFFNHDKALVGKTRSHAHARVRGKLYHLVEKGYPALVPGNGWVTGELLELVDFPDTIRILDEIENYLPGRKHNEYNRVLTPVRNLETGEEEDAYVYWYAADDLNAHGNEAVPIPKGDWPAFMAMLSRKL